MPESRWNDDAAFEAHIAPAREALSRLLDVSDELRESGSSLPAADSQGMAEIAAGREFRGPSPWGDDPVEQAHNQAQLLLVSANDCSRALVRLLSSDTTPVYAHTVLGRASLELAGRAWWLVEAGIGVRLRIARIMNERLFGLSQENRLPLNADDLQRAQERREGLLAEAARLGFNTAGPARQAIEEERPGQTEVMRKLFRVGEDEALGELIYGMFSAVAHGTTFGLADSVTRDAPDIPKMPGVTWGAVYTSSGQVLIVLTAVLVGIAEAYRRRNELFGWRSESWSRAFLNGLEVAKKSFPSP
jgi:hypothetical protein